MRVFLPSLTPSSRSCQRWAELPEPEPKPKQPGVPCGRGDGFVAAHFLREDVELVAFGAVPQLELAVALLGVDQARLLPLAATMTNSHAHVELREMRQNGRAKKGRENGRTNEGGKKKQNSEKDCAPPRQKNVTDLVAVWRALQALERENAVNQAPRGRGAFLHARAAVPRRRRWRRRRGGR